LLLLILYDYGEIATQPLTTTSEHNDKGINKSKRCHKWPGLKELTALLARLGQTNGKSKVIRV
jgi:hypothetical protein